MTPSRRALLGVALLPLLGSAEADEAPCCGPVTAAGERLARELDGTGVERLWLAGTRVDWRTGAPVPTGPGPGPHTHCSAFVAAIAERLGVYILRPPQHRQELLANAQMRWLAQQGRQAGWREVSDERDAQALANRGMLVVASYENPDPHRPGHIAILRPSRKSAAELAAEGPQIIQAGGRNYLSTTLQNGFRRRRLHTRFFAHPIP